MEGFCKGADMTILLGVLLVAAVLAGAALAFMALQNQRGKREAEARAIYEAHQKNGLAHQVQELSKYRAIVDVDGYVAHARAAAAQVTAHADASAHAQIAQARAAVAQMISQAEASAQSAVRRASEEANATVAQAQVRAQEIAGDALQAVQKAKALEQTARAMQNVIDGYGDRYLLPTSGLLDDLAEEFGFAEAGKKLKEARDRTRTMAKHGDAALCDYVENNRRETAIAFVLDAFNGKVDTALADVRETNFGTLRQKLLDAYALVNHHGTAFRNARIAPAYLDARLDELKWAVAAVELKAREREEQRAIKERIREEEKAQRDFERAQKEVQKEEETIRKAMTKARAEIEKASSEQKAMYEERLRELGEKLHAAELKNQRALSMAQQTKSGHVYVISNEGSFGEDVFKIGMTRRLEPNDRIRELGDASVPFEFDVHALIRCGDAPALENALHKTFVRRQMNKVNPRKEFFRIGLADIRAEIERLGIQCSWTMTAECREFRETQVLERALAKDPEKERAWASESIRDHAAVVAHAEPLEVDA